MSPIARRWTTQLVGVGLLVCLAGCGGKSVTTAAQDMSFLPGPPMTEKVAPTELARPTPTPAPERRAPVPEAPTKEEMEFGKPGAMEEARVTEPPAPPLVETPAQVEAIPVPAPAVPVTVSPPAGLTDVFFDYDRAAIRSDGQAALEANASRLKTTPDGALLISRRCDERGTLAYNLVLGERRAQAAARYLTDLGLPGSRIEIVSYGKEKPFCTEHSQACWRLNRRAHFQKP